MKRVILALLFVVFGCGSLSAAFKKDTATLIGGFALAVLFFWLAYRQLRGLRKGQKPKQNTPAVDTSLPKAPVADAPASPVSVPVKSAGSPVSPANEPKTVYAPNTINGCQCQYQYQDVEIVPHSLVDFGSIELGAPVVFSAAADDIVVRLGSQEIGVLKHGKLADMVSDWLKRGDPIFSVIKKTDIDSHRIFLFVVFYRDLIALAKRRGIAPIKLISNSNEEMQENISIATVGDLCCAVFDYDKNKWEISQSALTLGFLPSRYSENENMDDCRIVVCDTQEDVDSGKWSIWVYII